MTETLSWTLATKYDGKGADDMAKDFSSMGDKAKSAGKAVAVGLGAAGAAGAGLMVSGFAANLNLEAGRAKLAGQLALSTEDAAKAGEVASTVYGDNWGANMDEVNEAIRSVDQNIADVSTTSKAEITKITESALALSSTMGTDVALSTEAVGAIMKNGLAKNSTEAFDIITAGMQNGVNKADDLLETFQEYSPQFSKLGISGKDALNLLSAGLKAGARDTDVIADAFKELSIRAIDGSTLTADGFKAAGLNAKKMAVEFGKGGESARAATQKTMEGLLKIEDPIKRNTAGTALFGTQWEDTVSKILPALANADEEIQQVDGSTQKMADTVGDTAAGQIETMKRSFEQWTQSLAEGDGAMALAVTGMGAFGGGAVEAATSAATMATAVKGTAAAEKIMTAATWLMNAGLKALKFAWLAALGPVGLIVAGIALVAAGLVLAYKRCETFRNIVNSVFKHVASTILWLADKWLGAWQLMFAALGKLPGKVGAPFRAAASAVDGMRGKIRGLRNEINGLKGKTVSVRVNTTYAVYGNKGGHYEGGTFVKNALGTTNLAAGQLSMVGEDGPELIATGGNSRVFTAQQTGQILAARAAGAATMVRRNEGGNTYVTVNVQGSMLSSHRQVKAAVVEAFEKAPGGTKGLPANAITRRGV